MKNFQSQNNLDYKNFIRDIVQAKKTNSLFCFVGAGTSISQGYPNWNEYVDGMIDYWSYHLEDIVSNPKTIFSKVKASDRKFLQWLKKANYSKERKVDLVHEIISEYSQCTNPVDSSTIEKQYVHQYEQTVFIDTEPILKENKVLNELVNLRPIFITTNYDEQIEQACKLRLQLSPTVYSSIDKYHGEELVADDILHLHGMPKSSESVFISSSQSYLKMYNEQNKYKEQINKLFSSVKKPLMIFVGSSLQENEVLHFFNFENVDMKKYAIMLFQSEKNELDNIRSEKLKRYYLDKQGIMLIWYEKNFNDLPVFLQRLNEDIDKEASKNIVVSEKELQEKIDDEDNLVLAILKAINNQEYMIVDEFLGKLRRLSPINNLFKNRLFLDILKQNSNQLLKFWNNVVDNFDGLSSQARQNALKIVQCDQAFNSELANLMITVTLKYWKSSSIDKKCNFLRNNISRYLNPYIQLNIPDETVKCLYLVSCLKYTSSYVVTIDTNQKFDFDDETYILLIKELQKIDKTGIFYSSWKEIKDKTAVHILFDLFTNGNIRYKGRKDFPINFYTYKIVQKILVNVDLSGINLTKTVRKKLFSKIDWNFKSIGIEFNEINRKYELNPSKKSEYFTNGITNINGGLIDQQPFFEINIEKDIKNPNNLLNRLSNSIDQKSKKDWNRFSEKSISGQNNELLDKLCNINYWCKYSDEYVCIICGLFKDVRMYKSFNYAIGRFINLGLEQDLPNINEIIVKYINFLKKHLQLAFTYPNSFDLWKKIINCKQIEKKPIYQFVFKEVSIKNLAFSVPMKGYFDIQDYLQTDFFNYCSALVDIEKIDKNAFNKYLPGLLEKIKTIDITKREMFKGIFFNYIYENDSEKYSKFSLYFFAEYHNGINKSIYLGYKKVIKSILKKEVVNNPKVINFITVAILCYEKPRKEMVRLVTESSFKSQIYNFILTLYWNSNKVPQYAGQWINSLVSYDKIFVSECIKTLVKYVKNEKNKEFDFLFNILNSSVERVNYKLRDGDFVLLPFIDDCSVSQLNNLVKLIKLLCSKGYMLITKLIEFDIEIILSKLNKNNLDLDINCLLDAIAPFSRQNKLNEWNKKYRDFNI